MKDSRGIIYSSLLHGAILFFLLVGLPDFFHKEPDIEPEAVSVEILPIAPVSNVKQQQKRSEPEKLPEKDVNTSRKPTPESAPQETKSAEPEQVPLPVKRKTPKQPKRKKPEEKKPQKNQEDLNSVLNSVKDQAKTEESKKPSQEKQDSDKQAKSDHYDASQPLSMSEKDAIRSQIEQCWNAQVGAKDAQNLIVTLHITLAQDGSVTKAELAHDQGRYASDPYFRAAADAATRAVERCSPLKNLPADKYGTWGDMELDFNPRDMLQ